MNIKQYEEEIKRLRFAYMKNAESKIEKHIEEWEKEGKISWPQKDHLMKFNKMLAEGKKASKGDSKMYSAIEILKEMYKQGMIDQEEYIEEVNTYRMHVGKVIEMNNRLYEKRDVLKHVIVDNKKIRSPKKPDDIGRINQLYAEGVIDEEELRTMTDRIKGGKWHTGRMPRRREDFREGDFK